MITLIGSIVIVMIGLMIIGLIISKQHRVKLDNAEVQYNKYYRVNCF